MNVNKVFLNYTLGLETYSFLSFLIYILIQFYLNVLIIFTW
jgi:hypothetical protein